MGKRDIKNLTLEELKKEIVDMQEPAYRARQIFFWLYQRGVPNFDEMSNIPRPLRDKLDQNYNISTLKLSEHLKSTDRAEKFLFQLSDGNFIESVLIYAKNRKTICLSTQVGCKFVCSFCASGLKGFIRNLTPAEITNQILFLQHNLKHKITNYVLMGMGEPLDNYENTSKAIMIMNDPEGMGIGARRITISTCGIIPGIKKLEDLELQVNLSVSLHATNNNLRDELIPINRRYPLEKLIKACEDFVDATGRMITLEYVLIKGKNDSLKDADELAKIAKKLKAKVNLVPYSTIPNLNFQSTGRRNTNIFMNRLINRGVNATLRESKGKDIQAACGQLAGRARE
jgi:23S rRNA (adenine2503-C2)-methyltransferase